LAAELKADIGAAAANARFVRIADLYAKRSEGPVSAQNDRPKTRPTVSECIMLPVETSKRALASKMQTIEIYTLF
jgi:hypothetical protein